MGNFTYEKSSTHFNSSLATSLYTLPKIDMSKLLINPSGWIFPAIFVERKVSAMFKTVDYEIRHFDKHFTEITPVTLDKILRELDRVSEIVPTANQFVFDKDVRCFGVRDCAYKTGTVPFIFVGDVLMEKEFQNVNMSSLSEVKASERSFGKSHIIVFIVGEYVIGTTTSTFQDLAALFTVKFIEGRFVEGSKSLTHLSETAFVLFSIYISKLFELPTATSTAKGRYKELLTKEVIPLVPVNLYTETVKELNAMSLDIDYGGFVKEEIAYNNKDYDESVKNGNIVLFSQILDDSFPDSAPNLFIEDIVYVQFDKSIEGVLNGNVIPLIDKKDIRYGIVEQWSTLTVLVKSIVPVDICVKASIVLEDIVSPHLEVATVERGD